MTRLMALAAAGLLALPTWAAVAIQPDGEGFAIKAARYEAAVGGDGCLTSLRVAGQEFFVSQEGFPRGGYPYQDGILRVPGPTRQGLSVTADSELATLRYDFTDEAISLAYTNKTDKEMVFVIVFQKEVAAVRPDAGKYRRAPYTTGCAAATWFRLPAQLTVTAPQRIWGPWGEGSAVMTAPVAPRQTATITLAAGVATAEEQEKAQQAMTRVTAPPTAPTGPMWDLGRFGQAPKYEAATGYQWAGVAEGVQPILFAGPPFEGQPTRVFAWLGVPPHAPEVKLPGIVLVHGGGGSAFAHWVKMWNDRGYAAIALDTCGCVPVGTYGNWERDPRGGPPGWGGFDQLEWPREDQWDFHAIADIMLAHSLLRSLPDVDPARVGVTGISWGGYLTSLVAGVDPRFAFAAPVYGCGFTMDMTFAESLVGLKPEQRDRWMRWWDPSAYLRDAAMPILWVNGTNDFAYTMNGWQKSYRQPTGPRWLSLGIRMEHGHTQGEVPEEIHAFADQVLKRGVPLCRVTGQGRAGSSVWATWEVRSRVTKAELCFTRDGGKWPDKLWEVLPATVAEGKATATLPEGSKCYYLNLTDERGLVVSTEHEELP